jgi:hypothetical protein
MVELCAATVRAMPNPPWMQQPTPAAMLVERVQNEHPSWTLSAIARHLDESLGTVARWRDGGGHRPRSVATAAAWSGYDPRDFGIDDPAALAAADKILAVKAAAPDWATAHHADLVARMSALEQLLRDECEHVRVMEKSITNHLRKA